MAYTPHKVQIAYIHGENVSHNFHHSIMRLSNTNPKLYTEHHISALSDAMSLPESRNALMNYFLDETDATHIWWIDTDMGFAPDTVENLLQADKHVIGALCKGLDKTEPDGFGGYITKEFVTAYEMVSFKTEKRDEVKEIVGFQLKQDLDLTSGDPIPVAATGTGCLLISRAAAALIRNLSGPRWFERVRMSSIMDNSLPNILSEDLSFCYRLSTVGIPVFIHPKVRTTHAKTVWLQ